MDKVGIKILQSGFQITKVSMICVQNDEIVKNQIVLREQQKTSVDVVHEKNRMSGILVRSGPIDLWP